MNSAGKHAVIALLVISVAGCAEKKANTAPPAQAQAPALDAGKAGALYPPPLTASSAQPENPAPAPPPVVAQTQPAPQPQPPPSNAGKTASKHKSKASPAKSVAPGSTPASPDTTASATAATGAAAATDPTTVAANGEPAAASPIGELSTPAAGQTQTRKETVDLITNTENGVNGIKRTLSPQEEETVSQIRTFLSKAKIALGNEDLDGAFTLATKAKVLLDELNKS